MSRAVVHEEPSLFEQVAPLAGAAVGTAAVTLGSVQFDLTMEKAAIGAAVIGYVVSQSTTGAWQQLGNGIAAAGIGLAIREFLRSYEPQPAVAPAGITRAEMQKAITDAVADQKKTHEAQVSKLHEEVKRLQAELAAARGEKPAPTRNEAPKRPTERPAAPLLTREQGEKMDAILAHFNDEERAKVHKVYNDMPAQTIRNILKLMSDLPVEDGVSFVRSHVLVTPPSA